MVVKFTEISRGPFLAEVEGVTDSRGMAFEVNPKTGLALPCGVGEVTTQVTEGKKQVKKALKDDPVESLYQINHQSAMGLITWIESNERNKEWYINNIGRKIDLVQDGIMILGKTWKLEDEKADEYPKEGIWNKDGCTYFSFDAQKKLFGQSVPSRDDLQDLWSFLPGTDANKVSFLRKVLLYTSYHGYRCNNSGFLDQGVLTAYWSSTPSKSGYAYSLYFTDAPEPEDTIEVSPRSFGFCVRCFKK